MSEPLEQFTEAQLRVVRDPEARPPSPLYTNHLQVTFTPEDFTLHFGWYTIPAMTEPPAEGVVTATVEPVARLTLPLNLMRNVIALLERQLQGYEANFGTIPQHPNPPAWMKETSESGG